LEFGDAPWERGSPDKSWVLGAGNDATYLGKSFQVAAPGQRFIFESAENLGANILFPGAKRPAFRVSLKIHAPMFKEKRVIQIYFLRGGLKIFD